MSTKRQDQSPRESEKITESKPQNVTGNEPNELSDNCVLSGNATELDVDNVSDILSDDLFVHMAYVEQSVAEKITEYFAEYTSLYMPDDLSDIADMSEYDVYDESQVFDDESDYCDDSDHCNVCSKKKSKD